MTFYVFYLHIAISAGILLIFLPVFITKIGHYLDKWLPKTDYIENEKSKQLNGLPSGYFVERKYPDLFEAKNLTLKYSFKKENFVSCLITIFIIGMLQLIIHEILNAFINTNNPNTEKYFITTCLIIDFAAYWSVVLSMVKIYIVSLMKELEHIKYAYSFPE